MLKSSASSCPVHNVQTYGLSHGLDHPHLYMCSDCTCHVTPTVKKTPRGDLSTAFHTMHLDDKKALATLLKVMQRNHWSLNMSDKIKLVAALDPLLDHKYSIFQEALKEVQRIVDQYREDANDTDTEEEKERKKEIKNTKKKRFQLDAKRESFLQALTEEMNRMHRTKQKSESFLQVETTKGVWERIWLTHPIQRQHSPGKKWYKYLVRGYVMRKRKRERVWMSMSLDPFMSGSLYHHEINVYLKFKNFKYISNRDTTNTVDSSDSSSDDERSFDDDEEEAAARLEEAAYAPCGSPIADVVPTPSQAMEVCRSWTYIDQALDERFH